jgi:hypothetical protein
MKKKAISPDVVRAALDTIAMYADEQTRRLDEQSRRLPPVSELKKRCLYALLCARDGPRHARFNRRRLDDVCRDGESSPDSECLGLAWSLDHARDKGSIANVAQFRVFEAYYILFASKKRPPLIGELLQELHIDKPNGRSAAGSGSRRRQSARLSVN